MGGGKGTRMDRRDGWKKKGKARKMTMEEES